MDDPVIIYTNNDNTISIINPTAEGIELYGIEGLQIKDVPIGKLSSVVGRSDLPEDRTFRDAWEFDHVLKTLSISLQKAQEIKRQQFRNLRKAKFNQLDIEVSKALAVGNTEQAEIYEEERQILRDVTEINLPESISELATFIPDCLK